jgi:hypothetical protein
VVHSCFSLANFFSIRTNCCPFEQNLEATRKRARNNNKKKNQEKLRTERMVQIKRSCTSSRAD